MRTHAERMKPVEIYIDPSKVGLVIIKAREFDAKVDPVEPDPGSHETESGGRKEVDDYADGPTLEEVCGPIDVLDEEELVDLVALAWIGRGDFARDEWAQARCFARKAYNWHARGYLIGMPGLGDYLEEGLAELGYGGADVDAKDL